MSEGNVQVQPGDVIAGKYRVDRVLGAGGMGVVVAATHAQLDQRVALKFLLPAVLANGEAVARFLREARAAVRIHSEHVSRVIDVGTLETGAPYMVMELLEGEDLEHVLAQRGPLPVAEAVGYVLEACEAIAEAHHLGIVHRDLKPANLFLARRPSGPPIVKVLDFGISKAPLTAQDKALTSDATLMGSPSYMSPEQMRASKNVDPRSDIWSLGVVLYELVTRALPFPGDTMAALVAATLQDAPLPLRAARPDVPPAFQALVERCLEKDPARRFADVAELSRALVPFGPPRAALSLERIVTVLGQQGSLVADPRTTGSGSGAIAGSPQGYPQAGAAFGPTAAVTGGLPAPNATLSPTSARATPSGGGRRLVIPGAVVLGVVLGAIVFAVVNGKGGAGKPPSSASPAVDQTATAVAPVATVAPVAAPTTTASATAVTVASAVADIAPAMPSAVATVPMATGRAAASQAAHGKPPPSAAPTAAVTAKPACRAVPWFDADGEKHFRQECP